MSVRPIFIATLLVSSGTIAYEILLMRMLSIAHWHHFAYMIISLALLGYGASGTAIALAKTWIKPHFETVFAASALLCGLSMVACFVIAQDIPFNALAIVWDPRQLIYLSAIYLTFFLPFFFAASCIGMAFTCLESAIARIYFSDLLGAGLGAIGVIIALFLLPLKIALLVVASVVMFGSLVVVASWQRKMMSLIPLSAIAGLIALAPSSGLNVRLSEYKGLNQALQVIDSRKLVEVSSPLGLLTVVDSPTVPFRHVPGLSFKASAIRVKQLGVFTDGDSLSVITAYDGDLQQHSYYRDVTAALPYRLHEEPEVLILGAGAGSDVLMALQNGARAIDAVELNPQMTDLVTNTFAEFAGFLYADNRVTVHRAEARGFVERSDKQYDLVQIGLLDSFAVSGSGVQALGESYLYTTEALDQYLARLRPQGMLSITRWVKLPPRDNLKLVDTAVAALKNYGVTDPSQHIVMIRSWNSATLLVKPTAFTAMDIDRIKQFAQSLSFDTAYYPSMPPDEANRYNQLDAPYFYQAITALLSDESEVFKARYKFSIGRATDDRPYFFHFFRWRTLPELLALREHGGGGLIEWGYLVLIATLVQAIVFGALLILLPLACVSRRWSSGYGRRAGGYFFLIGLAFLFVELAFIQKFTLFLSHPLYAVAIVLAGFLIFAGLGSASSVAFASWCHRRGVSPFAVAVSAICVVALLYIVVLPGFFRQFAGWPDYLRAALSIALIAPLAFFMGMPFPLGLSRVAENASDFVPWAWGLNGFASVISTVLATITAIALGFTWVVVIALVLYALAAMTPPSAR